MVSPSSPAVRPLLLASVAALASVSLHGGPAAASTAVALDLVELSRSADEIVAATVLDAWAEPARGGYIVTRVTVEVFRPVAGRAGRDDLLEVVVPGGELGSLGLLIHGAPRLEPGRRYLLFLERRAGELRVLGMAQGALPVRATASGRLEVSPPEGLPGLVRRQAGRLVAAAPAVPARTPLERLVARIVEARRAPR